MPTYKVKKGDIEFYIQPEMIEGYAKLGYEIIRIEEVVVEDIKEEVQNINLEKTEGFYEQN